MTNNTNVTKLLNRLVETKAETVKLGMDLHARDVVVCVQLDGALPQRPQKMNTAQVLTLVRGLVAAGRKVYSCYEAGPCGYGLHRDLLVAKVTNYVVVPEKLADGRNQKTDGLDATALAERLDRYVRGNTRAFTVVTVPTVEQERARAEGRLRDQLKRSRSEWEARGRSLLLCHGQHVTGTWWAERRWTELKPTLSAWLVQELERMRTVILLLDTEEKARRTQLEAQAPKVLPKAVGALTWVLIALEICNWARFRTRRQVSSYTGLCPGVHQSGGRKRDGSINRHGNPRVRALLIELVWRTQLEAQAPKVLPKAVGALTWVLIALEICNWARFRNRRQVSSYTGLCPGVHQSGGRKRDGSINRHGNPRVRALLIELVWRLVRWQPDYPPVRALVAGIARGAARRKLAVAAARRLAVDLWRLATKQTTPEKLQLIVPAEVPA